MLDNMDGKHARNTDQCSKLGGFLDHFVDGMFGTIAGHKAVAVALAGVSIDSQFFYQTRHLFCCLWLAPHIVSKFSGRLSLGSKLFSVDDAFIAVTGILAAASLWELPLIEGFPTETIHSLLHCGGPAYVVVLSTWHSLSPKLVPPSPKKLMSVLTYFAFFAISWSQFVSHSSWWISWIIVVSLNIHH